MVTGNDFDRRAGLRPKPIHVGFATAEDTNGQTRPREGMPLDDCLRKAQLTSDGSHLVLVKVLQRFHHAARRSEAPHKLRVIVMRFDGFRFVANHLWGRFDQVRTQGTLPKKDFFWAKIQLLDGFFTDSNESVANDLSLLLRIDGVIEWPDLDIPSFTVDKDLQGAEIEDNWWSNTGVDSGSFHSTETKQACNLIKNYTTYRMANLMVTNLVSD